MVLLLVIFCYFFYQSSMIIIVYAPVSIDAEAYSNHSVHPSKQTNVG